MRSINFATYNEVNVFLPKFYFETHVQIMRVQSHNGISPYKKKPASLLSFHCEKTQYTASLKNEERVLTKNPTLRAFLFQTVNL
jgi:hypothetical protein